MKLYNYDVKKQIFDIAYQTSRRNYINAMREKLEEQLKKKFEYFEDEEVFGPASSPFYIGPCYCDYGIFDNSLRDEEHWDAISHFHEGRFKLEIVRNNNVVPYQPVTFICHDSELQKLERATNNAGIDEATNDIKTTIAREKVYLTRCEQSLNRESEERILLEKEIEELEQDTLDQIRAKRIIFERNCHTRINLKRKIEDTIEVLEASLSKK